MRELYLAIGDTSPILSKSNLLQNVRIASIGICICEFSLKSSSHKPVPAKYVIQGILCDPEVCDVISVDDRVLDDAGVDFPLSLL